VALIAPKRASASSTLEFYTYPTTIVSHMVMSIKIITTHNEKKEKLEGILNLVDFAGSERLKNEGMTHINETKNINKSLANLGNVSSFKETGFYSL